MSPKNDKLIFPLGMTWMKVLRNIGEADERIRRTGTKENITVTTILKGTDIMTPGSVAKSVKYLRDDGFIHTRRKGREILITLTSKGSTMSELLHQMEMWGGRKWY